MASAAPPPADETPTLIIRGLDPFAVSMGAKLSLDFIDQLCARVSTGHGALNSALALGVSRRTFKRWITRGQEELAALEQAAQEVGADPDFSDLTLYGYLCRKLEQTQAATVNDAEGRVYRDKPELYLRLSSAGRAAGWGNQVDVAVMGSVDHTHTVVAPPLSHLDDNQLLQVLQILEDVGAFEAARRQQAQDTGDALDALGAPDTVDALPPDETPLASLRAVMELRSAPVTAPVTSSVTPSVAQSETTSTPTARSMAGASPTHPAEKAQPDEDPFSERVGARYDPNASVFAEDARPRGLSGGDTARWKLGQRSRNLSDLTRTSGW